VSATADPEQLVRTAREVAAEWGLRLGEQYALALRSFVAPAGPHAVLKVTPPDDDESDEEADALALWDGVGAVRLLRHDRARRALLLERATPGTDIGGLPEGEATAVAVEVSSHLWRPADEPFRWIGDHVPRWLERAGSAGDGDRRLLDAARRLFATLDVGRDTLVHGDFHHHNVLAAGGRYAAIDPKPMLGEREFDVPSFLWNPHWSKMRLDVTERRIAAFAAAGLDEGRIRAWSVIRGAYLRGDEPAVVDVLLALA
jgi:streptomycin 6-kinase